MWRFHRRLAALCVAAVAALGAVGPAAANTDDPILLVNDMDNHAGTFTHVLAAVNREACTGSFVR